MQLTSLTIVGFRCFDSAGQTIALNDFNCFVGPNSSGKTATMMSLVRLFGEHPAQRQIASEDFYLGPDEKLKDKTGRSLSIECRLAFPELTAAGLPGRSAVPEAFNQMIVDGPEKPPFCRLRLEARWTDNGTPTGDIEQSLHWILTDSDDATVINDGHRRDAHASIRRRIRVIYVPAARDPEKQIAITTSTAYGRLLNSLSLSDTEQKLKDGLTQLQGQIGALQGIGTVNTHVQQIWSRLYSGKTAKTVAFRALEGDPNELLSLLAPHFSPGDSERAVLSSDLSDGMRSLFSVSLSLGLFQVEQAIIAAPTTSGFTEGLAGELPLLTVFAVEEPENHLSPHYLGRIVAELSSIAAHPRAQVLLSSHSPAIMGRVRPDDVRYCLGNEHSPCTRIKPLVLPDNGSDEAFKYVREAVRRHPEIYFSRLVIFGEGPSEEIILNRIFEASGTPLDVNFVSVVPLGGRHVNHFWQLVHGLGIPHLTLLDLDREKEGAGWARLEYVRNELIQQLGKADPRFQYTDVKGAAYNLGDDNFTLFTTLDVKDLASMKEWMGFLQTNFGIFFSVPLDIDLSLLEAFPAVYKGQATQGPRLPAVGTPDYAPAVLERIKQVLAANPKTAPDTSGETYTHSQRDLFPWYKFLFLDSSKPVAHMRAMIALTDADLTTGMPLFLKELVERAKKLVAFVEGAA